MFLDFLAEMIRAAAGFGASTVSAGMTYQPQTPACLLEDDE